MIEEPVYNGPEKRRFNRVPYPHQIKFRLYDRSNISEIYTATAENISASGILLRTSTPLIENRLISIKLNSTEISYLKKIVKAIFVKEDYVVGKVMRVSEVIEGSLYDVGISFIDIFAKDLEHREDTLAIAHA